MGGAGGLGQFLTRRQFGWDTQVGGIGGLGEEETDRRAAISILSMIFWLPSTCAGRGEGRGWRRRGRERGVRVLKRTFMITYDTLGCCNLRFLFLVKEKEGRGAELRRAFLRKYLTPFRFRSADSTVHVSSTMSQKHAPWVGGEEAGRGWKPRR